ncbi:MAG TPA: hypothetical protein VII83_05615 [Gaiellaceae bacterium]
MGRLSVSSRSEQFRKSLSDAVVREAFFAAALAGTLAALFAWLGPPGNDLAAHRYLRWEFLQHGLGFWNNYWYAGRYSYITYSPLYYPLAGLIGIRLLAVVSIAASAFALSMLVGRQWGSAARWSSRSFAVLWAGSVFSAAFPFALGGMLALFAIWALQARRRWLFAVCSFLTMIASPLAFVFLLLVVTAIGLANLKEDLARFRQPALALAVCLLLGLIAWRMFPSSGRYPFQLSILLEIAVFCALGAALTWRVEQARLLRWIFPLYLAASLITFVLSSQLGSNIERLRLFALPIMLLVFALRGYRPRLLVAPLLALALAWNLGPIVGGFSKGRNDPGDNRQYWVPAIDFLHGKLTPSYRVEAVDTANHWAALYLPQAGIPIVRGWFRQDDYPQNEIFYKDKVLSASSYLGWLRGLGARYVILSDAPSDFSSRDEAALIRSGRSGLKEVFSSSHLKVFEVPSPRSIVTGPGSPRVLALGEARIRLDLPGTGRYRLAVRYSPYLRTAGACVRKGVGGMTELVTQRAVVTRLELDFDLGRALDVVTGSERSDC